MEIEIVKELIKSFETAKLSGLSLKCEEFELKLEKEQVVYETKEVKNDTPYMATGVQSSIDVTIETQEQTIEPKETTKSIVSPIVGTFYSASNPKAEPFIKVGSKVKKGDIVCVIEAMKLMNEVESEVDGEVVEMLVNNEDMVEYGQPLFVLK